MYGGMRASSQRRRRRLTREPGSAVTDARSGAATFRDVIDAQARLRPDAPFLIAPEPGVTLTYADLAHAARAFAASLRADGVMPGDVVGFMQGNGLGAATVFLGTMYGGYVVSPLNLLAQDAHLDHAIRHGSPKVVFAAAEHVARLEAAVARISAATRIVARDPDDAHWGEPRGDVGVRDEHAPAMLMYTSGTTGLPKGVPLTHRNMLAAGRAVAKAQALGARDRVLSSLPLYHINGQCIATVGPLVSGGSIVMPHRFSVTQWWRLVEAHRPTWLNLVPTIVSYLLNGPALTEGQSQACRGVRFARSASAPLPPEQHRAFESRFGIGVLEALGLTECASVAFANPLDPRKRIIGSCGVPLGVDARVVAPDGGGLPDGARGEIEIRGDQVMAGYHRADDETARTLRPDGWLRTGDLGYRDGGGFYFITGRLKELIIKGGENIAPREIDEALLRHPAVLEGAAVGVADPDYGQEILGCVVVKPGATLDVGALRAHCERELGRYKTPKYLRIVAELPKGPSGKVQRLKLAEMVSDPTFEQA
jgi:long-chain acyl-CoA synthetase